MRLVVIIVENRQTSASVAASLPTMMDSNITVSTVDSRQDGPLANYSAKTLEIYSVGLVLTTLMLLNVLWKH
jgi:hypothetical protein